MRARKQIRLYPLAVNIISIAFSTDSGTEWRPSGGQAITVAIDSVIPQIRLPLEACNVFESVLGLHWDDVAEIYLVNKGTQSEAYLRRSNTNVTFAIQSDIGAIMKYTFPYSAFDLTISNPFFTTYYFPRKRASRPEQYLLGRVFL